SKEDEEFVADCAIESDLELRLPPLYVPQESERISLYQQLDNMESAEQIEEFRTQLKDRFGAIPSTTEELIKVVPLRIAAKRLGIERLTLKGGKMYMYFVGEENEAYYQSAAFGRMLAWLQLDPKRTKLRDVNGKRSFLVSDVPTVSEGLSILETIRSLAPV
ncbi:MAG: transcription-repair coupling factor, partial [Muribaculaceae bacterium]|nr:transcription-repair coupling factor [Muribaculaceae bacterium]